MARKKWTKSWSVKKIIFVFVLCGFGYLACEKNGLAEELEIISPRDGEVFAPGDRVTVKVEYEGDSSNIISAGIMTTDEHVAKITSFPSIYEFQIKPEYQGEMIIAVSILKEGGIEADLQAGVTILVRSNESPTEIAVLNTRMGNHLVPIYLSPGGKYYLSVEGIYSGGIRRDITSPKTGTTYLSSDPSVLEVSEITLTGKAEGKAILTVKNGTTTQKIEVIVEK